jgi:cobyrinic acid a,c-diamide synthase
MVTTPRIVIAAPASGHGKTSVATGLLAAYTARGLVASPHKVGPDYIDPAYHALAAGRPGRNLDPWLVGEDRIVGLFLRGAQRPVPADIAIVEGVMGLFDGAGAHEGFASTAHVAGLLAAPVVLVVDAAAQGRSIAALLHGFATFDPAVRLAGVVLNRVGSARHEQILREAVASVGLPVFGAIYRRDALSTPSRHLGLIPAAERSDEARATVDALAAAIETSLDLDAILALARSAPAITGEPAEFPTAQPDANPIRVAVAGGRAFTFGYAETAELLTAAGAEVVSFDPLTDEHLPAEVRAVVIGGGFPEMYAAKLSENVQLRRELGTLVAAGAPVVAECAGLLYLARSLDGAPMCDVLAVDAQMTPTLTLGYREAVAVSDSIIAAAGMRVRGHEFHRTTCTPAAGTKPAWQWRPDAAEGFVHGNVHASYLHLHWAGYPEIATRLLDRAADVGSGTDRGTGASGAMSDRAKSNAAARCV